MGLPTKGQEEGVQRGDKTVLYLDCGGSHTTLSIC